MIHFQHVHFRYGQHPHSSWICFDLSWAIGWSGIYLLEGASGRGKSTLLRLMKSELAPQHGRIKKAYRHHVSLTHPIVFQPHTTLGDYWRWFHLKNEALEKLDLSYLPLDTPMDVLSGGERVRVALTLLLTQHVDVYFLDEPCSGLNEKHQTLVLRWILEVSQRATCVIASHRSMWIPWAHAHLQLLEGEQSKLTIHSKSLFQKPFHPKRRAHPQPHRRSLFKHDKTALLGMMLSMFLTLSLASAWVWMDHLPTRHHRQLTTLSMVTLEALEIVELESSPYVLTKTTPLDQRTMQTLLRSFDEIVIELDFRSLFVFDVSGDKGTYAIEWVLDPSDHIQDVQLYGHDATVNVIITPIEHATDCLCSTTMTLTVQNQYPLESPFDQPTVFLSYSVWKTWLLDQYSQVITPLYQSQVATPPYALWGVFLDFPTYQSMKKSLRENGYRLVHGWFDRMQTLVELFSTLSSWSLLFLMLSSGTTVLLEIQRLAVFITINQNKMNHWIDFGASKQRLYRSWFSPFDMMSGGVGFVALSVWIWLWIQGLISMRFFMAALLLNLGLVLILMVLMSGYHLMIEKGIRRDYL